jgi:3-oxoacyl-[acyl-carrier protein] reductase
MAETSVLRADALSGEVALVTGASRGIGRAILQHLARAGASVIGTATSQAGADAVAAHIAEVGARGGAAVLNVRQAGAIDSVVESAARSWGAVSILVNNAGVTRDGLALRMGDEQWEEVIDTNLSGAFRLSRSVMRGMMKARHGRIINISSVVGSSGNAGQADEIAQVVAFLASPAGAYITGATVHVNGGMHMT